MKSFRRFLTTYLSISKTHIAPFVFLTMIAATGHGQVTFGVRVGMSSPVSPGTNHLIVNRGRENESLFNIREIKYSPQPGFFVRIEAGPFWFMGEILGGQYKARYTMQSVIAKVSESVPAPYLEKNAFVEIPLSAGVALGKTEILSGFTVSKEFALGGELLQLEGFTWSHAMIHLGWHAGIRYHLDPVSLDLRYHQQFCNYGHGQFLSGQELLLKNAPGRVSMSLAFHF